MSTGLNALSGVLVQDLLQGYLSARLSTGTWLKTFTAVMGFVCVGLVYLVERLGGVLQVGFAIFCALAIIPSHNFSSHAGGAQSEWNHVRHHAGTLHTRHVFPARQQ
jgi:Na+/proline symporter